MQQSYRSANALAAATAAPRVREAAARPYRCRGPDFTPNSSAQAHVSAERRGTAVTPSHRRAEAAIAPHHCSPRHPWRRIQEPLPIVLSHTYFQLTPADTPRSLIGRRAHQEDSPRCSSRTAQLTHWLQQLRRRGSEKLLLDLIAAEDPTSPRTPALKHT